MFGNYKGKEEKNVIIPNVLLYMDLINKSVRKTFPLKPGQLYLYFENDLENIIKRLIKEGYRENIHFRRATLTNHLEIKGELKEAIEKVLKFEEYLAHPVSQLLNLPGIYSTFIGFDSAEYLCFPNKKVFLKIIEKLQTEEMLDMTDFTTSESPPQSLVVDKSIKRTPQGLIIEHPEVSPSFPLLIDILSKSVPKIYNEKPGKFYLIFNDTHFDKIVKSLKEERFRENFHFRKATAKNHLEIMGSLKDIILAEIAKEHYLTQPVNDLLNMRELYNVYQGWDNKEYLLFKNKRIFEKIVEKLKTEELLFEGIDFTLPEFPSQSILVSGRIKKNLIGYTVGLPDLEPIPKKSVKMPEEKMTFPWFGSIQPLPMTKDEEALLDLPVSDLLNKAFYSIDPVYPHLQFLSFPFSQGRFIDDLINKLEIEADLVEGIDFSRTTERFFSLQVMGRIKKTEEGILISPKVNKPLPVQSGQAPHDEFLTLPAREILNLGAPDAKKPDKNYLRFQFSSGRLLKQLVEKLKSEEGLVEGVDFNIVKNQYCTLEILGRINKTEKGIVIRPIQTGSLILPFWAQTQNPSGISATPENLQSFQPKRY